MYVVIIVYLYIRVPPIWFQYLYVLVSVSLMPFTLWHCKYYLIININIWFRTSTWTNSWTIQPPFVFIILKLFPHLINSVKIGCVSRSEHRYSPSQGVDQFCIKTTVYNIGSSNLCIVCSNSHQCVDFQTTFIIVHTTTTTITCLFTILFNATNWTDKAERQLHVAHHTNTYNMNVPVVLGC